MALQINRSNVAGYIPASLVTGELFYNSADDKLFIGNPDTTISLLSADPLDIESRLAALEYNSGTTIVAGTAPASGNEGLLWFNTTDGHLYIKIGSDWQLASDPYRAALVDVAGVYPVSSGDFFQHIRFTPNSDEVVEGARFIQAATLWAEQYTGQFFTVKTIEEYFDTFPQQTNYLATIKAAFNLKGGTTNSISSVKYYNKDAVLTTVDPTKYRLINKNDKGYLLPALQEIWPTDVIYGDSDVVIVSYSAGKTPAEVSASVKSAILLIAASMFENRENEVVGQGIAILKPIIAAKDLLHPYKVR